MKSNRINQASKNPTRKLSAAVIGIAATEVTRTALTNWAPGWSDPAMWTALSPMIVFACGWFIKDDPNIVVITQDAEQ